MFKKVLMTAAAMSLVAGAASAQDFPERELLGVIMWGAGGATDVVARAVTPAAEEALGGSIVMLNRAGASGAIATTYVATAPADGYTLLYGAENPQLYGVTGLSELDYADFYPVNILGRGVGVIVTAPDAPWDSFAELVADAQERPGEIRMGSTGPGGIPFTIGAMLSTVAEYEVTAVPFEGEGPGLTALQGGHIDYMPVGASAAADLIEAGTVKALAVFDNQEVPALPGIPPITDEFPELDAQLPWGPFYGVFVRADTPDDIKQELTEAFEVAANTSDFQRLMAERSNIVMNISGARAAEFLAQWQSSTAWALYDAGAAERSPEEFDIPRP
ncbi:Bug family tripartite tricarboxylate transporter substrate binding protein [Pelagibacterium halotolerans]|uniref:Bug family tripartite tricarboxylate transporter substrate binding protein n=1 Tax=Pelagibacterium halotolerans TaxID=531813 RepID=UPI0008956949|nr:tripartite tricarboxylate transporter substrate binding protein [Pelagibacterium halotolerans]QJR18910.1 tripartite tricarboxylate transporter substrate binding protein [Pelagibacterium halotolerans]SEA67848.1 Tripartite-type tricarboxylate transporter, receptor component TctC [Pelagibacterium halotolerans]